MKNRDHIIALLNRDRKIVKLEKDKEDLKKAFDLACLTIVTLKYKEFATKEELDMTKKHYIEEAKK